MQFDIYLDSDGVLVDFDGYCLTHFGKLPSEFEPKKLLWESVTHHDKHVQKFFLSMPLYDGAHEFIDQCKQLSGSVKILTASGFTPHDVKDQKIQYYMQHRPDIECIVVDKSPDKARYASPHSILIDDREKSIAPWVAAGGIGILHTSFADTIAQLTAIIGH